MPPAEGRPFPGLLRTCEQLDGAAFWSTPAVRPPRVACAQQRCGKRWRTLQTGAGPVHDHRPARQRDPPQTRLPEQPPLGSSTGHSLPARSNGSIWRASSITTSGTLSVRVCPPRRGLGPYNERAVAGGCCASGRARRLARHWHWHCAVPGAALGVRFPRVHVSASIRSWGSKRTAGSASDTRTRTW